MLVMFQFQSGAIKCQSLGTLALKRLCFNSNLVRLNVFRGLGFVEEYTCFNSNLVRLNEAGRKPPFPAIPSFNSNLVRLKADLHKIHKGIAQAFQFQSGAIKGEF